MDFYQTPPGLRNQYLTDCVLINYPKRTLPPEVYGSIEAELTRLGERVVTDILATVSSLLLEKAEWELGQNDRRALSSVKRWIEFGLIDSDFFRKR